jgi:hypothetical protein
MGGKGMGLGEGRGQMFTINIIQLAGIIAGSAFLGSMIGFFAAALLGMASRSDEEERRSWPGGIDR